MISFYYLKSLHVFDSGKKSFAGNLSNFELNWSVSSTLPRLRESQSICILGQFSESVLLNIVISGQIDPIFNSLLKKQYG